MINSFAPVDKALIDVRLKDPSGYPSHLSAGDTRDVLIDVCRGAGAKPRDFPKELWIEPNKWHEKARENDENGTWPMNFIDRYTNQNPTHECTTHSISRGFEGARNRMRGLIFKDGPKAGYRYEESKKGVVWVSIMSVYAEANPGQWGGASIRGPMEIACRRGFLPDKIQPAEYKFKHSLQGTAGKGNNNQSSGPWTRVSGFPSGWEETAALLKIDQVIFPEMWEQAVCLVLHGRFYHVGRGGHAVPWGQARFSGNSFDGMAYPDSYDVTRYDSLGTVRSAWSGGFSIDTVTAPDNWLDPAGTLAA